MDIGALRDHASGMLDTGRDFRRVPGAAGERQYEFHNYWNPDGNPVRIRVLRRETVDVFGTLRLELEEYSPGQRLSNDRFVPRAPGT